MEYKPLYTVYYNDRSGSRELYRSRFESPEAVKLGFDIAGSPAFYYTCREMGQLITTILRLDKKITVLRLDLPEEAIRQFKIESLLDEIVITNQIEGVHSTRKEIKDVVESLGQSRRSEQRFEGLVNHYILLGESDLELKSCEDLRAIYDQLVLHEVLENDSENQPDGVLFRKESVSVRDAAQNILHTGIVPEEKIIAYMQKGLDLLNNSSVDILIRTAVFHYLFGYIHPFYDGNGRLSRFISSFFLSKDLDPLIGNRLSYTIQENIRDYYKMFKVCNDPINRGDLTPFVLFFLEILQEAEENLLDALSKRRNAYVSGLAALNDVSLRNHWDALTDAICRSLLVSTLFSKGGSAKKDLLAGVGIKSTTTLNTKLSVLKQFGLIDESKDGNRIFYRLNLDKLWEYK